MNRSMIGRVMLGNSSDGFMIGPEVLRKRMTAISPVKNHSTCPRFHICLPCNQDWPIANYATSHWHSRHIKDKTLITIPT